MAHLFFMAYPNECPTCGGTLQATRLACTGCQTALEGRFDLPPLLRLPRDDQAFIADFVRHSGSLKDMARLTGVSYPTVRTRLDAIIGRLDLLSQPSETRGHQILDSVARGTLSVSEAARILQEEKP